MSLINDALKRAKEVQEQSAPPPVSNLQFRPIEPAEYTRQSLGLMLPAALAVVALLVLFFALQWTQRKVSKPPMEVKARTAMTAATATAPQPALIPVAQVPATAVPTAQPIAVAPTAPTAPQAADSPDVIEAVAAPLAAYPPAVVAQDSGVANTTAATQALPPKPKLPKLQAIVFSPARPSVMISGKTLFIGDKLNGFRVTAIDQESATLVGGGQTNVLSLSE